MEAIKEFLVSNWPVISTIGIAVISEVMGANPKWKYNGLLHIVSDLLKKSKNINKKP